VNIAFYPDSHILECSLTDEIKDIKADCDVRNELNVRRALHSKKQVIYAMTEDPHNNDGKGYPVMPRTFPTGRWNVTKPRARTDPYRAPFYIPTDAEQYLDVWELDENGGYDHVTCKSVLDIGYGMHFSSSKTTVGCIRIHDESDLMWLVHAINERLLAGHSVHITA